MYERHKQDDNQQNFTLRASFRPLVSSAQNPRKPSEEFIPAQKAA
jgi:hypothetical protein